MMSTNEEEENDISPLFSTSDDDGDGEHFRDKVRALFEHFDTDKDNHLKYPELSALQKATSGELLTEEMYVMACRALDCTPQNGISLDALKLTYVAEGSNIEKDYYKVFPDRKPKAKEGSAKSGSKEDAKANINNEDADEKVYEVGADGTVDIS